MICSAHMPAGAAGTVPAVLELIQPQQNSPLPIGVMSQFNGCEYTWTHGRFDWHWFFALITSVTTLGAYSAAASLWPAFNSGASNELRTSDNCCGGQTNADADIATGVAAGMRRHRHCTDDRARPIVLRHIGEDLPLRPLPRGYNLAERLAS